VTRPSVRDPARRPWPARLGGALLASGLGAVAKATRRRPIHARGRTWRATLCVDAPVEHLGVPLFADRGVHPCTARLSRAVGTPPGWWDVGGLALRLPGAGSRGADADLLFATTGTGRVSRHLLRPVRETAGRPLTTLLPTRAGGRSFVLLARPLGEQFEIGIGIEGGAWHAVGLLRLDDEVADRALRFDPVVRPLAGTHAPGWVAAVREPAYRWARRLGRP
jgi:hypothetical protein